MARVNAPQLAFSAGEISPAALARVDVEKLRLAARCQVNWDATVIGSMSLRAGLGYLGSTKSDAAGLLLPFVFGTHDTALLELTALVMRVWKSDALITRPSVATVVTNGDMSSSAGWTLTASSGASAAISGGRLTLSASAIGSTAFCERSVTVAGGDQNVVHGLRIIVGDTNLQGGPVTFQVGSTSGGTEYISQTTLSPGTHSIAFTPTSSPFYVRFSTATWTDKIVDSITVEASGVMELPTPWTANDLSYVRIAQSADIVYVACDGIAQYQIERRNNDSWSVVKYRADKGPFVSKPAWAAPITMALSAQYGNVTLTTGASYWKSSDVGSLIKLPVIQQDMVRQIGAANNFTEAFRLHGIGTNNDYSWVTTGTWVGTIRSFHSYDSAVDGFARQDSATTNTTKTVTLGTDHDNVITWVRFGFDRASDYTSGNVTVTVSYKSSPGEVGGFGIARVTSYSSATVVNAEMLTPTRDLDIEATWKVGKWASGLGYPSAVALDQGRLWWAGRDDIDGSVSDDYTNFDDTVEGDSGPISRTLGGSTVEIINWILPLGRLMVGTEGAEVSVRSSSQDEPLTPTNAMPKSSSTQGSANLPALKIDNRGVFVEKSGRRVFELAPDPQVGDYVSYDLTKLNLDIGIPGFVSLAVQRQPDTRMHFVRSDGQDAILLREPQDEVTGWTRSMTLGVIERVCVLPGNIEDSVYYIVKRTINGSTKRFIEKKARRDQCVGASLNYQADAYVSISQASSTTITGLSHLEGETVVVWANAKDLGSYTVSGGQITGVSEAVTTAIVGLGGMTFSYDSTAAATIAVGTKYNGYPAEVFANRSTGGKLRYIGTVTVASGVVTLPNSKTATRIIVYLGYYAPFVSAKLAYGAQMGTALNQRKKINAIGLIAENMHPQALCVGQTFEQLDDLPLIEEDFAGSQNEIWDEYDNDVTTVPGEWDTDARLCMLAAAPRPVTLSGVVVSITTHEK
jgi:hypothetical protein